MMAPAITCSKQLLGICQINLEQAILPFDPAGWYSVLFGHFPGAEITIHERPSDRLTNEILSVVCKDSLKFILLGLDRHRQLRCRTSWLETLVARAREEEFEILIYGEGLESRMPTFGTREQAMEAALSNWEAMLLDRFSW